MISSLGSHKRWARFFPQGSKSILVPVDHGLGFGPSNGILNSQQIAAWINDENIDGIIAHRGILEKLITQGVTRKALMLQLSGMSATDNQAQQKELLTSVEYASLIGADAVSVQANFDGHNDRYNLINIAKATEVAKRLGFPILAMLYNANSAGNEVQLMRHYLRIAVELGVDAVKIPFYRNQEQFVEIITDFTADLAIFIAGGALEDEGNLLEFIAFAKTQGIAGVSFGRNVFQRANTHSFLQQVRKSLASA